MGATIDSSHAAAERGKLGGGSLDEANLLPMTSAATPVSATAKQQYQNNDNEDQFHEKPP